MGMREFIESEYTVENGIIVSPGEFECEPVYVPDFWAAALDGCGEDNEDGSVTVAIEEADHIAYPELDGCTTVRVWKDDDGFVHSRRQ